MSDYRENLADELAIDRDAPQWDTNTEPPADVVEALKSVIRDARQSAIREQAERKVAKLQYTADIDEAIAHDVLAHLSAQPAPSQSGLVYECDCPEGHCLPDALTNGGTCRVNGKKSKRTNNQPAPDDGLVDAEMALLNWEKYKNKPGQDYDEVAYQAQKAIDALTSALTAKDHTALREARKLLDEAAHRVDVQPDEIGDADQLQTNCGKAAVRIEMALARIDQALATKGDGE